MGICRWTPQLTPSCSRSDPPFGTLRPLAAQLLPSHTTERESTPCSSPPTHADEPYDSYPASVAAASADPANTGPSVEPSFVPASSFATGKIAAAVSVPLIVIAALVAAYVAWTKYKKRPEQKRWSTVRSSQLPIRECN